MSILAEVRSCLVEIDIEDAATAPPDSLLDELGMDSQELVSAMLQFEKRFGMKFRLQDVSRGMSLLDLCASLTEQLVRVTHDVSLGDGFVEDTVIKVPQSVVHHALFEFETWPQKLPHVCGVRKHYNDGRFQEFEMDVRGANGSVLAVRSVRRCDAEGIRFFQPQPPKFLRHHCGGWVLRSLSEDRTLVATWHQWHLSDAAGELFPARPGEPTGVRVRSWLREHARFALGCWKAHLEGGGK